jgi:pimeloyl-ACP methyl ester carboxylesterase
VPNGSWGDEGSFDMAGGNDEATLVLVHGANGGAWYWDLIGPELDSRGVQWVAMDLPSVGEGVDPATDCHADAAHVRAVVDGVSGPVVLCGSSYGGVVITEASATHDRVRHLVYLAAFMPDADDEIPTELFAHCSPALLESATIDDAGRLVVDPSRIGSLYIPHASPEVASSYGSRMRPMALGGSTRLTGVGWHRIPSTYVVCTEDPALLPESQRRWAQTRATNQIEVPFDHLPQISHPAETAELLANITRDQVSNQPTP